MSWTAKLTAAAIDPSGTNANIKLTIQIKNDQTNEVQTREVPSNGMTGPQLVAYAQQQISLLNLRDGFLPTLQAATDPGFILAQG